MRLFLVTRIGVFICTNGPGFINKYPVPAAVVSNIFDLIQRNNRSVTDNLSRKVDGGMPFIEHQLIRGCKMNRATTGLHDHDHHGLRNRIEPEDILGTYGHPHDGDLSIRYAPGTSNTTLQLYFSEWAYGRLQPITGSNTTFSVEWDTSIMDHFHSYPSSVPNYWIDFGIVDTVLFRAGESDQYDEFKFVKNATLDTFPAIPWSPNSCGPERKSNKCIM